MYSNETTYDFSVITLKGGGMMVGDIRCIFQFPTLPLSKLFLLPKSDREGSKILIWFQLEGSTIQQNYNKI